MTIAVTPKKVHQVFFNYRGEQLRYNFVSHLSDAFERHDIKFFVDEDELRGNDLKNLFARIEESNVALAIFSTRYAESRWCMDELVEMKKLADQGKLQVIPIFYKVEPQDVRAQEGEFGDNFWTLAKKSSSSSSDIKNWKDALECISDKAGLPLGDKSSEADFVKKIVKDVYKVIEAIGVEEEENHFGKKGERSGIATVHMMSFQIPRGAKPKNSNINVPKNFYLLRFLIKCVLIFLYGYFLYMLLINFIN